VIKQKQKKKKKKCKNKNLKKGIFVLKNSLHHEHHMLHGLLIDCQENSKARSEQAQFTLVFVHGRLLQVHQQHHYGIRLGYQHL
jgi:hypothetical protein